MDHHLRQSFTVHSFDVDAFGDVSPAALFGYLQEVAANSARSLGFGLDALFARGQTWVIARQQLELSRPVRQGDTLEVETFPSGLDRLAALRDFRLRVRGEEVGRAVSVWFALDLASRRPVDPAPVTPLELQPQRDHVLPIPKGKLPDLPGPAEVERRFQVRFADIDLNEHVTNASYVAWACEALPEEEWRTHRVVAVDAQFLAECHWGVKVLSRSAREAGGTRLHSVLREDDGREIARLRTRWAPRA